jgi:hypothetical protein
MSELTPGWLNRQFDKVEEDIKSWPTWMKREAGLETEAKASAAAVNLERPERDVEETSK